MKKRNVLTMQNIRDYVVHTYPDYLHSQVDVYKADGEYVINIATFSPDGEVLNNQIIKHKNKMEVIKLYIDYVHNNLSGFNI